jgi:hypothetical protein
VKKVIIFFLLISFAVFYLFINKNHCSNNQAKIYLIENKNFCLLTANNQEQWEKGLMFYKKPVNFDGMIFIFPEKEIKSFWNKNTYLDLDIYWMDGKKVVSKSYLPSILKSKTIITVESQKEVDRVVEIIR